MESLVTMVVEQDKSKCIIPPHSIIRSLSNSRKSGKYSTLLNLVFISRLRYMLCVPESISDRIASSMRNLSVGSFQDEFRAAAASGVPYLELVRVSSTSFMVLENNQMRAALTVVVFAILIRIFA